MSTAPVNVLVGDHVHAQDPEGRYVRGWVVAKDEQGRVQLDRADDCGQRTGWLTPWLTEPEHCKVYVQPTFRYFCVSANDGTGDVIDNNGRRKGDSF